MAQASNSVTLPGTSTKMGLDTLRASTQLADLAGPGVEEMIFDGGLLERGGKYASHITMSSWAWGVVDGAGRGSAVMWEGSQGS